MNPELSFRSSERGKMMALAEVVPGGTGCQRQLCLCEHTRREQCPSSFCTMTAVALQCPCCDQTPGSVDCSRDHLCPCLPSVDKAHAFLLL